MHGCLEEGGKGKEQKVRELSSSLFFYSKKGKVDSMFKFDGDKFRSGFQIDRKRIALTVRGMPNSSPFHSM
jgi:hypothetical protein